MKEGWEYKKLGEVCMHKNKILRAAKHYASDEQITYIDISSIDNSQNIILSTTPYVFSDAPSRAQQIVEKGDVLVSLVRPNLKNIAIVNIDNNRLVASSGFCVLRAETNINNRYIFYIVRGNAFTKYLLGRVQGANYPAVREDDVKSYSIPIPPLAEQERIVAELDLLSSIIDKKKAQLKELDQLAQSIFYDMFGDPISNEKGWEVKKLGEVCIIERGGSPRPIEQYLTDDENGINWIKIGDATEGGMVISSTKQKIIPEGVKKSRFVHKGDFLLSNSMSFGKPYILGVDGCIHDGWLVIQDPNEIFNKIYLYYFLGSPQTYESFRSMAVGGVVNNLNKDMVKRVFIAIPNPTLQKEFAEKIEAIEQQKSLIQQSIDEVQMLFDSRMDYWFD